MSVNPNLVRGFKIGTYTKTLSYREAALYALGVGANHDPMNSEDLKYTYENHQNFTILPSFTAQFSVLGLDKIHDCEGLPDYDHMSLLHGEQRLIIHKPLKIGQELISENSIVDIADKKSGALVTVQSKTFAGEEHVTTNFAKLFIRGIGGFGEKGILENTKMPKPSSEESSHSVLSKGSENQAHIYRWASGDLNPLHVDPVLAKSGGGFDRPILHGLCSLGY